MESFADSVYSVVAKIPKGRVTTYAAVANSIHHPKAARAVGNALNKNSRKDVPCHRVIRSDLKVGGFARGSAEKMKLLESEGVRLRNGRVPEEYLVKL